MSRLGSLTLTTATEKLISKCTTIKEEFPHESRGVQEHEKPCSIQSIELTF